MCKYAGGKQRIAKELHAVMINIERRIIGDNGKLLPYLEPFAGMCSVAKEFNDGRARTLCDLNPDIVKLWQAVLYKNWRPPYETITETYYDRLRARKTPSAERGFYGTSCAFSGSFMAGFSGRYKENISNLINTAYNKICLYKSKLQNSNFINAQSYNMFEPNNCIVYCDPPYARTIGNLPNTYLSMFDSIKFWNVMRTWSKSNLVFISEENAPHDFIEVWRKHINRTSNTKRSKNTVVTIDKLFIHKRWLKYI